MKILSLQQPYGSLMCWQEKRIETRSWATDYAGLVAIHVSAEFKKQYKRLCFVPPFRDAIMNHTKMIVEEWLEKVPLGHIIGVTYLARCIAITEDNHVLLADHNSPTDYEWHYGDYTPGRWAWLCAATIPLRDPIPHKGALGLRNVARPLEIAINRQLQGTTYYNRSLAA